MICDPITESQCRKLAHNFMIYYLVFISSLLDMTKKFIKEKIQNIISSTSTRERKNNLGTLSFGVSQLVPLLRH